MLNGLRSLRTLAIALLLTLLGGLAQADDAASGRFHAAVEKARNETKLRKAQHFDITKEKIQRELKAFREGKRAPQQSRRPAGTITGIVYDDFFSPLAFVDVMAFDLDGNFVDVQTTGGDGSYAINTQDGSEYYLVAGAQGLLDVLWPSTPCEGYCNFADGAPVPSAADGIDFVLSYAAGISGTVTSLSDPIPNLDVYLFTSDFSSFSIFSTYDDGTYQTGDIPAGAYIVLAGGEPQGLISELYDNVPCHRGVCDPSAATVLTPQPGDQYFGIDFDLDPGGFIQGTVTETGTGNPLSTPIIARNRETFIDYNVDTNPDGSYSLRVDSGTYSVLAWPYSNHVAELYDNVVCAQGACNFSGGADVPVALGQTVGPIDFSLAPGGSIEGFVTDSGAGAVSGGFVSLFDPTFQEYTIAVATEADGHYVLNGMPTGDYFIGASVNQFTYPFPLVSEIYNNVHCPDLVCDPSSGSPVHTSVGSTTSGINFALERGGMFQGQITDDAANPLSVQVIVFDSSGNQAGILNSNTDGSYVTPPLLPGSYFALTWTGGVFVDELYDNHMCPLGLCNILSGNSIPVSAENTTPNINFVLSTCGGSVGISDPPGPDLPAGLVGAPYTVTFTASGSTGPYSFSSDEPLPPGLTLSSSGVLSGTPTVAGDYFVDVNVVSSTGCASLNMYTMSIAAPPCLFCDEFEDGVLAPDWTYAKGTWSEGGGDMTGTSTGKGFAVASPAFGGCASCTFNATMRSSGGIGKLSFFGWYIDKKNSVELMMNELKDKWLLKYRSSGLLFKAVSKQVIAPGVDYDVAISYNAGALQVMINGATAITLPIPAPPAAGTTAFQVKDSTGSFGRISVE